MCGAHARPGSAASSLAMPIRGLVRHALARSPAQEVVAVPPPPTTTYGERIRRSIGGMIGGLPSPTKVA